MNAKASMSQSVNPSFTTLDDSPSGAMNPRRRVLEVRLILERQEIKQHAVSSTRLIRRAGTLGHLTLLCGEM